MVSFCLCRLANKGLTILLFNVGVVGFHMQGSKGLGAPKITHTPIQKTKKEEKEKEKESTKLTALQLTLYNRM